MTIMHYLSELTKFLTCMMIKFGSINFLGYMVMFCSLCTTLAIVDAIVRLSSTLPILSLTITNNSM